MFLFGMPVNAVYFTSYKTFQRRLAPPVDPCGLDKSAIHISESATHLLAGLGAEVCGENQEEVLVRP